MRVQQSRSFRGLVRAAVQLTLVSSLVILGLSCDRQQEVGIVTDNQTPTVSESEFGIMPDGQRISQFIIANSNAIEVTVINYGGIITSIKAPDKDGQLGNIVLGFDELDPYLKGTPYFGALIGRYGNRI